MPMDPWLPIGHVLADGTRLGRVVLGGADWQIADADRGRRVLLATPQLADTWVDAGLVTEGALAPARFGTREYVYLVSGADHMLTTVGEASGPRRKSDAIAFAAALRETRERDTESPLQDAIYVEKLSRLLPLPMITSRSPDDVVLGFWLSGGMPVSAHAFRRLHQAVSWLPVEDLKDVVEAAGFEVREVLARGNEAGGEATDATTPSQAEAGGRPLTEPFRLPGRPELEQFINEHVVDVLRHRERYKALGIGFPGAVVLHGPPGSGKTYAVERLVEYLGWPSYQIDASSVASPFIHETSRKVASVFETAQQNAPSVLVIDEMEAFLADREMSMGSGHHRVEEVAEFLRRIPEAAQNDVLIVAMTNRVDMIDPAIMRRGRFDHVISVGYASSEEVHSLLSKLLGDLPTDGSIDVSMSAKTLSNRPLSDVAFVIREAARLAARSGRATLNQECLEQALRAAPARDTAGDTPRRVGFV